MTIRIADGRLWLYVKLATTSCTFSKAEFGAPLKMDGFGAAAAKMAQEGFP